VLIGMARKSESDAATSGRVAILFAEVELSMALGSFPAERTNIIIFKDRVFWLCQPQGPFIPFPRVDFENASLKSR